MREYIKLGGILFAITLTVALALGVVNSLTKDKITQNQQIAQSEAVKSLIDSTAQGGAEVSYTPSGNTSVDKITEHTLENGDKAYSVSCKPNGYDGVISMTVGLDNSLNVTGVAITAMRETPGLGARAKEPVFYEQFIGKKAGVTVTKGTPSGNQIQAISGATITSKAVARGVNDAITEVQAIVKTQVSNTAPANEQISTPTTAPTENPTQTTNTVATNEQVSTPTTTPTESQSQKPTTTTTPDTTPTETVAPKPNTTPTQAPTSTPAPTPNVQIKAGTTSYTPSGNTSVDKISKTVLANGQTTYSVSCSPNGYEDVISMVVGLDSNLNITGVKITSINDTPGLGARATEPSFLSQFTGKKAGVTVTKGAPSGNQIQAISGATITSRAVTKGVNDAISEVKAIAGGGN